MKRSEGVIFKATIIVLSAFMVFGCEGDDGHDKDKNPYCCNISCNVYAPTEVIHYIDDEGGLVWENASDVFYYETGDGDVSYTITWNCATYEKCTGHCYVSIDYWDWADDGLGWILESEFIDSGICDSNCPV